MRYQGREGSWTIELIWKLFSRVLQLILYSYISIKKTYEYISDYNWKINEKNIYILTDVN